MEIDPKIVEIGKASDSYKFRTPYLSLLSFISYFSFNSFILVSDHMSCRHISRIFCAFELLYSGTDGMGNVP